MKNYFIICCLWLLCGIITVNHAIADQTLNIGVHEKFPPFTWSENGQATGIDVDITKELCRRINVQCNIEFIPFKRMLLYTKQGKVDGGLSPFKTPAREEFAYFLEYPVHYSTYNIFVKKGHEFQFQKIEDLYGKTIGKNRVFKLSDEFDNAVAVGKIQIEVVDETKQNIGKLMMESIDGMVSNQAETLLLIKERGLSNKITYLTHPVQKPRAAYLVISKQANIKNKIKLIDKMNQTLKIMYNDGTIDQINAKYLK